MNKDVFHNQVALLLGYERIVKDKSIDIKIDNVTNPDDPEVIVKLEGIPTPIVFNSSQTMLSNYCDDLSNQHDKLKYIVETVHQAYILANTYPY